MLVTDCTLRCGDVGFVGYENGSSFVTDAIGFMTTGEHEAETVADHQFQVLFFNEVLEALASLNNGGVVVRSLDSRISACIVSGAHYIIFRPTNLTWFQRERIARRARKLNGKRYGYVELLLQTVDGWLRKKGWLKEGRPLFTRLGELIPWTVICSGAGNRCLYDGGVLPRRFLYLSPDGTYDEAIRRGWRVVAFDKNGASYWTGAPTQGEAE